MQDKDDLFERRLNDYISGMITDEEKVELFSLAVRSYTGCNIIKP